MQRCSLYRVHKLISIYVHCDLDLRPPKSTGFILSPWLTCVPSLIKKHTTVKSLSCSQAYFDICPLWPWPLTSEINRILPLIMVNMSAKFDKQEAQRATYRAPEYNVPPFWRIGQGGLFFSIGPKNTNLVEDVEILLPVKFRWIPFSGFRGEVENVSANQRPGRPACFSNRPKKHKLGRGRWDLASCQVSLNSVQRFQRRSRKCLSQSEARTAILFFRSAPKTQTW